MTSSWQTIIQEVNSNENKALLWSLLTEEQVFSGLNEKSIQPIITLFETAIHTTVNTYAQPQNTSLATLSNLNKDVIQRVIKEVANYKIHTAATATSMATTPYTSADIQEARIKDITSKVKVLENDMNAFLVLKKPPEIDFSDKNVNDDAPIGDNMDQLIKEALAARERELEIIQFDIPPLQSSQPSESSASASVPNKKTVSFESTETDIEIGNIFNKLKRSQPEPPPPNQGTVSNRLPNPVQNPASNPVPNSMQVQLDTILHSIHELHSMIMTLSSEVQFIKNNMFEPEAVDPELSGVSQEE
jgi:hypothetical protein